MRILLVEDNVSFAGDIESAFKDTPYCEIDWVCSHVEAVERLSSDFYDIILLDREISPTRERLLEASVEHGWSLFLHIVAYYPGIPVRFLTGFWDTSLADNVMAHAKPARACGSGGTIPMYYGVAKSNVHLLQKEIEAIAARISIIDNIPVEIENKNIPATREEERVLRLFANIRGGVSVAATPFTEGLSGASVYKVSVLNADGSVREVGVAKIGPSKDIEVEQSKHRDFFTQLEGGCVPNRIDLIDAGAGSWAGAFYALAGRDTKALFSILSEDQAQACAVVVGIENAQVHWWNGTQPQNISVRQIRQRYIGNVKLNKIAHLVDPLDIESVEGLSIVANSGIQHRDLHGGNILVNSDRVFSIIDYAEAQIDCSCSDAVTLELSIIFHKDSLNLRKDWPSEENLANWSDLDEYLDGCPFPEFVKSCRDWAFRRASTDSEIWATAYAIALRQLQYSDVDKRSAILIAESCMRKLRNSD